MISEEVWNKSIVIVTPFFHPFHHSLTLVVLQTQPLRSALKAEVEGELLFTVFIPDQVCSQSGESELEEEEELGGGGNWRDEDSPHTCINHESRAAEGLRPSASKALSK